MPFYGSENVKNTNKKKGAIKLKIYSQKITIGDVFEGYVDNNEEGVVGYGGKLNIRPKYQREFVYKDKQRDLVLDTIKRKLPLNVIYWVKNKDGTYEVLDGQQRTISFCSYINGDFSINYQFFHNLTEEEQQDILNYELMVYICEGTEREKLEWFKIINIAGVRLTNQELRNAIYTGEWLTNAKRYFSKTSCPAYNIAKEYMKGTPIRQDYLEATISWIADIEDKKIEEYMAEKQSETDAEELWMYFQRVINWVKVLFPTYRKEMKGIDWGLLYNEYKDTNFNSKELEEKVAELMLDEDVTKKKGIYEYLITGNEKHLNIRAFSEKQRREAYERQKGICVVCNKHFELNEMEADHITPWHAGGKTIKGNCQMLCIDDNRAKSGK